MQKIYYKLAAGTGAAILAAALMAGSAFAADIEISDNGADSNNTVTVTEESCCTVVQSSQTNVGALVGASASTGGNSASGNTGGNTSITTGNATATASVTVVGGSNVASNPCCCQPDPCEGEGCLGGGSIVISGNGDDSTNRVTLNKKKKTLVVQESETNVWAGVGAKAKTGRNRARNNTGGTTSINTGAVVSDAFLDVTGGGNTLNP